jgi:hypothetical protein
MSQQVWYVKEISLLKTISAKHGSKSGNDDSRRTVEKNSQAAINK